MIRKEINNILNEGKRFKNSTQADLLTGYLNFVISGNNKRFYEKIIDRTIDNKRNIKNFEDVDLSEIKDHLEILLDDADIIFKKQFVDKLKEYVDNINEYLDRSDEE